MKNAIDAAADLGREFAEYLNQSNDRDNWSELENNDDLPEEDYVTLRAEFGEVTSEMERAYKSAFNAALS